MISPQKSSDLNDPVMRRQLGKASADYLSRFQAKLRKEFDQLKGPQILHRRRDPVVLTKSPDRADICLTAGVEGVPTRIVEVAKDPSILTRIDKTELRGSTELKI